MGLIGRKSRLAACGGLVTPCYVARLREVEIWLVVAEIQYLFLTAVGFASPCRTTVCFRLGTSMRSERCLR